MPSPKRPVGKVTRATRKRRAHKVEPPPRLYPLSRMPRVDVHVHIRDIRDTTRLLRTMSPAGIDVCVDLSGTPEKVERAGEIHKRWKGRILFAPGNYSTGRKVWWSKKDLDTFRDAGCAGTKIHCKYQRGLNSKAILARIRRQGELDLPVLGLHIGDPPVPGFWQPTYWDCIADAEKVIRACPNTTFIMAHGFWLMNDDKGLDVLAKYFDRYEHLNADLSAVFQWWDPPEPTYDKLRRFVVRYKDRLLYGTDGNPKFSRPANYRQSYRILETRGERLPGFFGGPHKKTYIKGLGLSKEVLNYIYYWNAARLIPRVRESLLRLGYQV